MYTHEDVFLEMIDICNEKLSSLNRHTDFIDYYYYTSLKEYCEKCLKKGR